MPSSWKSSGSKFTRYVEALARSTPPCSLEGREMIPSLVGEIWRFSLSLERLSLDSWSKLSCFFKNHSSIAKNPQYLPSKRTTTSVSPGRLGNDWLFISVRCCLSLILLISDLRWAFFISLILFWPRATAHKRTACSPHFWRTRSRKCRYLWWPVDSDGWFSRENAAETCLDSLSPRRQVVLSLRATHSTLSQASALVRHFRERGRLAAWTMVEDGEEMEEEMEEQMKR